MAKGPKQRRWRKYCLAHNFLLECEHFLNICSAVGMNYYFELSWDVSLSVLELCVGVWHRVLRLEQRLSFHHVAIWTKQKKTWVLSLRQHQPPGNVFTPTCEIFIQTLNWGPSGQQTQTPQDVLWCSSACPRKLSVPPSSWPFPSDSRRCKEARTQLCCF